ncbi:MAG: desaturase [Polaromonas sp. 24-62-144]|nr:MAG: desaturase [Polaromonas sp. 24-62-144]
MKVAVIGAGWAGCAAAVEATRRGHAVTLFEASRTPGGRARRVEAMLGGQPLVLDNGQHILIGAYTETLRLMTDLGVDTEAALLRLPLTLQFPDGSGLKLPASRHLPAPLDAFAGILSARGWRWADKLALLRVATGWQFKGFQCASHASVADLCRGLTAHVMTQLIEPLCVSALNTPAERASGQVFLRVLRDALFAETGGSNLLLPRVDLSALLPDAALAWLAARDQSVQRGLRVQGLRRTGGQWQLRVQANAPAAGVQELFDRVVLACPPAEAARLVESADSGGVDAWLQQARALQYEALTTVYAHAPEARLGQPMLALPATAGAPAQFAFDRGQLGGPAGFRPRWKARSGRAWRQPARWRRPCQAISRYQKHSCSRRYCLGYRPVSYKKPWRGRPHARPFSAETNRTVRSARSPFHAARPGASRGGRRG